MFNIEKTLLNKRKLFVFNYKGKDLKGVYHNGEITWFHPQPVTFLNNQHLDEIESKVHKEMIDR
ncbi:hypothetical protein [Oceanobacillus chungangensis]|uniref:Uncharacterized protein n=1 Tax=Oceanobacillus chungangensis TaxID=1229152 RepID=A0A3D8Q2Z1_9BACI|nr:hypothetical protein [Oceanobacillus chungangensis]RDW22111.1 hypothetical protein CWR45_01075 [Oceanobacillus chungangensis]